MAKAADHPSSDGAAPKAFRHLPDAIRVEDTVTSIRGDLPPEPSGERNAFIAAAVNAGG